MRQLLPLLVLSLLLASSAYAIGNYSSPRNSTIIYYHLNNDSSVGENSTRVYDFSNINRNNASVINATFNASAGYLQDGAYEFNGINNYIQALSVVPVDWNNSFTVGAWAKTRRPGVTQVIVAKQLRTFEIQIENTNNSQFSVWHSNTFSNRTLVTYKVARPDEWHRYVGIWNGTHASIAIDGYIVNTTPAIVNNTVYVFTDPLIIGQRNPNTLFFNGTIDEVIVDNSTLSSEQILSEYRAYIGNCSVGTMSDCTIGPGDMTIQKGNYSLQSFGNVNTSAAMRIIGNNTVFDMNGSEIIDAYRARNTNALFLESSQNITLQNGLFKDWYYGITRAFPALSGGWYNITLRNVTLQNITYMAINADNWDDSTIIDTNISNVNYTGIRLHSADRTVVTNTTISTSSNAYAGIFNDGRYNNITDVTLIGASNSSDITAMIRMEQDGSYNNNMNIYDRIRATGNGFGYGFVATEYHFNTYVRNSNFTNFRYCMQPRANLSNFTNITLNFCNRGVTLGSSDAESNYSGFIVANTATGFRITGTKYNVSITYNDLSNNVTTPFSNDNNANVTIGFNNYGNASKHISSGSTISYATILLRNTLVYYNNNTLITNTIGNQGSSVYVAIPANNWTFVLDDFNITEGEYRRNSPGNATCAGSTCSIAWSMNETLHNVTVVLTPDIVPSSPRLSFPNGSSVYPSYSYDSVGGVMSFEASIPSGVSTLQISTAAGPDLGCVQFSTQERTVFVAGIVGALALLIFLWYSNPATLLNVGITVGIVFFITVLGAVIRGMC